MAEVQSLDHFAISVLDVDAAGGTFERLGFQTLPLMRHIELGTANRVIQLHDTYFEVVGHFEGAPAFLRDHMMPRYAVGEGLSIVSLTCSNLEREHARIAASQWQPGPIVNARRRITLPGGVQDETDSSVFYVWRPGRLYSTLFFTVHSKPETIWVPACQEHPNTARRVRTLTYFSADPRQEIEYVQTMLGARPTRNDPDRVVFQTLRGEHIEFLSAGQVRERFADLAPSLSGPEPVFGIGLTIEVDDLSRCIAALESNEVPFERGGENVIVPASQAHGVVLTFR